MKQYHLKDISYLFFDIALFVLFKIKGFDMSKEETFKRKLRMAKTEELRTYVLEENKHLLFSPRSHRFIGGPLLYQVNIYRKEIPVSESLLTMHPHDMIHEEFGNYLFSLHRIYMECSDPTEYTVAQKLFGSFKLWQAFVASATVAPHIEELREELALKLKSEAMASLRETMLTEGSKGTTAAKYLAEMNKVQKQQPEAGSNSDKWQRGRAAAAIEPTNEQLEDGFEEDIARLNLVADLQQFKQKKEA